MNKSGVTGTRINLRFHAVVCPLIKPNEDFADFFILIYRDKEVVEEHRLKLIKVRENEYIVTGILEVEPNSNYVYGFKSNDGQLSVENIQPYRRVETRSIKDSSMKRSLTKTDVYDGLILPHKEAIADDFLDVEEVYDELASRLKFYQLMLSDQLSHGTLESYHMSYDFLVQIRNSFLGNKSSYKIEYVKSLLEVIASSTITNVPFLVASLHTMFEVSYYENPGFHQFESGLEDLFKKLDATKLPFLTTSFKFRELDEKMSFIMNLTQIYRNFSETLYSIFLLDLILQIEFGDFPTQDIYLRRNEIKTENAVRYLQEFYVKNPRDIELIKQPRGLLFTLMLPILISENRMDSVSVTLHDLLFVMDHSILSFNCEHIIKRDHERLISLLDNKILEYANEAASNEELLNEEALSSMIARCCGILDKKHVLRNVLDIFSQIRFFICISNVVFWTASQGFALLKSLNVKAVERAFDELELLFGENIHFLGLNSFESEDRKQQYLKIWSKIISMKKSYNQIIQLRLDGLIERYFKQELSMVKLDKLVEFSVLANQLDNEDCSQIQNFFIDAIEENVSILNTQSIEKLSKLPNANRQAVQRIAKRCLLVSGPGQDCADEIVFEYVFYGLTPIADLVLNEDGKLTILDGSIVKSIDRLRSILRDLIDGTIKLSAFEYLQIHLDSVVLAAKKFQHELNLPEITSNASVRQLFQMRKLELDTYRSACKILETISNFFVSVDQSVVTDLIDNKLNKFRTADRDTPLNSLLSPYYVTAGEDIEILKQKSLNRIDDEFKKLGVNLSNCELYFADVMESAILRYKNDELYKNEHDKRAYILLADYMESVVRTSRRWYMDQANSLKDGKTTVKQFNESFAVLKDIDKAKEEISRMLKKVSCPTRDIKRKLEKLEILFKIKDLRQIVDYLIEIMKKEQQIAPEELKTLIITLKKLSDLDNAEIDKLDSSVFKDLHDINHVDHKLLRNGLDSYMQNDSLMNKLQRLSKDKINTLIETASESENNDEYQVILCQSLNEVTTCYDPLIFNLSEVKNYKQFWQRIEKLNQNLQVNQNAPATLNDLAGHLDWFERLQRIDEITEEDSMSKINKINYHGIYVFALTKYKSKESMSLEDLITLRFGETLDDGKNAPKTYAEVSELRDKISLLGSNRSNLLIRQESTRNDTIEYFEKIFESVTKLGETFIKLIESGYVIFKEMHAEIYCCRERSDTNKNTIRVHFGRANDFQNIFGSRLIEENTVNSVNLTTSFLKKCHDLWLEHVKSKRDEFNELNYFRNDQLVILQTELAKIRSNKILDRTENDVFLRKISDMLYNLNDKIDIDLLKSAYHSAEKEHINVDAEEPLDPNRKDIEKQLKAKGFTRFAIFMSFIAIKSDKCDDYIKYCQQQDTRRFVERPTTRSGEVETPVGSFTLNASPNTLQGHFQHLYSSCIELLNRNVDQLICISYLGNMLKYINFNRRTSRPIERVIPKEFNTKPKEPKVLVCPRESVISTVLSLYMESKEQLLPTNDEVLFCTSSTTAEDLELFWRRVFFNGKSSRDKDKHNESDKQKLYCLVNAQDVLFDHASKAQELFDRLFTEYSAEEKNLNLYIVCSDLETDTKESVIVSSLRRYKIAMPALPDYNLLTKYLSSHFKYGNRTALATALEKNDQPNVNVRVIRSNRAGCGKSLYVTRVREQAQAKIKDLEYVCIPIKSQTLQFEDVFKQLEQASKSLKPKIFHFDIAYEVWYGVDAFLFNLLCLNYLCNSDGSVWRRSAEDLYLIEIMPRLIPKKPASDTSEKLTVVQGEKDNRLRTLHHILDYLPTWNCSTPANVQQNLKKQISMHPGKKALIQSDRGLLERIKMSCEYLKTLEENTISQESSEDKTIVQNDCLKVLLEYAKKKIQDPTWSDLANFAKFLRFQLEAAQKNDLFNSNKAFENFVLNVIVEMSIESAFSSRKTTDQSVKSDDVEATFDSQLMNTESIWKMRSPLLIFQPNGKTFKIFGMELDASKKRLINTIDPKNPQSVVGGEDSNVIKILSNDYANIFCENMGDSSKDKLKKIKTILELMGLNCLSEDQLTDPDPSYELTSDNIYKILAIFMRLQANIPVIIMGETGCGKTKLIEYMCKLQAVALNFRQENLIKVQVHSGTTCNDIKQEVERAEALSRDNHQTNKNGSIFTVLFFDEANTTEAVGTIKEIMCDNRCMGQKIETRWGLKIIAACNPYKTLSTDAINKFKDSGLGFFNDKSQSQKMIGYIPISNLVYRVQPLPPSLLPLIWDFGTLSSDIEMLYIKQIVETRLGKLYSDAHQLLVDLLASSQKYARSLKNESSYVSLRDIERALMVFRWFMENGSKILNEFEKEFWENPEIKPVELSIFSVIMSLNFCYHVGLQSEESRANYWKQIAEDWGNQCDQSFIKKITDKCYDVFLDQIKIPDAIARNFALKENVFMMLICIELTIPLFIVGKPGSSKSLAKTLVAQTMSGGNRLGSELLKDMKETHILNFQCSPHTTSENILNVFNKSARMQIIHGKNSEKYISVVVLEEIGLAEASDNMPLKVLQPLLESGVKFKVNEFKASNKGHSNEYQKVGFIGLSNWTLDPAKMNRGIFVNRVNPNDEELNDIVKGICRNDPKRDKKIKVETILNQSMIQSLSRGYTKVCEWAKKSLYKRSYGHRDFFGLRDFYGLIKMIYRHLVDNPGASLEWRFLQKFIKRNFGGLPEDKACEIFQNEIMSNYPLYSFEKHETNLIELIKDALRGTNGDDSNRYVLLVTDQEIALDILNDHVLSCHLKEKYKEMQGSKALFQVLFGSNFPNDQEYSQLCRNIRKAKLYMEAGSTVAMLNLEQIYASLYDALNQFYFKFGEHKKFVEIGLGIQRCKILVSENFRAIIIAEPEKVYDSNVFPVPLISRLEKYYITVDSLFDQRMRDLYEYLDKWCQKITHNSQEPGQTVTRAELNQSDIFNGLTREAIEWIAYKIYTFLDKNQGTVAEEEIKQIACKYFLQCAAGDTIIRLSKYGKTFDDEHEISQTYFKDQHHSSFEEFLRFIFKDGSKQELTTPAESLRDHLTKESSQFIQITTHSRLLSMDELNDITSNLHKLSFGITQTRLSAFDTQQQLRDVLRRFLVRYSYDKSRIFLIQCPYAHLSTELVDSARHTILDETEKFLNEKGESVKEAIRSTSKIVLILQLPKVNQKSKKFAIFQTRNWLCYHLDDLFDELDLGNLLNYKDKDMSSILEGMNGTDQIRKLLKGSFLTACSKVISNKGLADTNRAIQRIKIVRQLFSGSQDISKEFMTTAQKILSRLQKERQINKKDSVSAKGSILTETSKLGKVVEYGTAKSAFNNYIRSNVENLLAGLISFVDTNNNLDLLCLMAEDNQGFFSPFKNHSQNLWIRLFDLYAQKYLTFENSFKFSKQDAVKNEFKCSMNANVLISNNLSKDVRLKLPFSWLIKEEIDKLIGENAGKADKYLELRTNFKVTKIYSVLKDLARDSGWMKEIKNSYLNDLLLMSSRQPFVSQDHIKVVCEQVNGLCEKKFREFIGENALLGVHLAFKELEEDVNIFGQLNIDQFKKAGVNKSLVQHSAEQIKEKFETINRMLLNKSEVKWDEFMAALNDHSQTIDAFLRRNSDESVQDFANLKSTWQKIMVICCMYDNFAKHNKIALESGLILWTEVDNDIDLTRIDSFKEFQNFVDSFIFAVDRVDPKYIEQIDCDVCGHSEPSLLKTNACATCFMCKSCQKRYNRKKLCIGCGRKISILAEEIKFEKADNSEVLNMQFKAKLNSFYLDVIKHICFRDDQNVPEDKVIKAIFGDLFPWAKHSDDDEDQYDPPDFSLSASLKLALFKTLIRYSRDETKNLLEQSLEKLRNEEDDQASENAFELEFMYISVIEDELVEQSRDIIQACELGSSKATAYNQAPEGQSCLKNLELFAGMRFAVIKQSHLINHWSDDFSALEREICRELTESVKAVVKSSARFRYLIIKLVARRLGRRITEPQEQVFSWIIPESLREMIQREFNDQDFNRLTDGTSDAVDERLWNLVNQFQTRIQEPDDAARASPVEANLLDRRYWSLRNPAALAHMTEILNSYILENKYNDLRWFVNNAQHLEAIIYLPKIARMVTYLNNNFNRAMDQRTAKSIQVRDLVLDQAAARIIREGIVAFSNALTASRREFARLYPTIPIPVVNHDSWEKSQIVNLLASENGDGSCIYNLLRYLVQLNNDAIRHYSGPLQAPTNMISLQDVTDSNCFSFNWDSNRGQEPNLPDINKIVLFYSGSTRCKCADLRAEYDFDQIERSLLKNLLDGKRLIDKSSINKFRFHDSLSDREYLNSIVQQEELDIESKVKLTAKFQQPNELTEAIRYLNNIIDFLGSQECSQHTMIADYADFYLGVDPEKLLAFNEHIGRRFQVVYLHSIKQTLLVIRDIVITNQGFDPFEDDLDDGFRPITDNLRWLVRVRVNYISNGREYRRVMLLQMLIYLNKFIKSSLYNFEMQNRYPELDESLRERLVRFEDIGYMLDRFNLNNFKLGDIFLFWKCIVSMFCKVADRTFKDNTD